MPPNHEGAFNALADGQTTLADEQTTLADEQTALAAAQATQAATQTAQGSSITTLQSEMNAVEADVAALETDVAALETIGAWHTVGSGGGEPAFTNSWVLYDTDYTVQFCKTVNGIVFVRGAIRDGTIGSSAFTLPVGYRPDKLMEWAVSSFGGVSYTLAIAGIGTNGFVVPQHGDNEYFGLYGLTFRAA